MDKLVDELLPFHFVTFVRKLLSGLLNPGYYVFHFFFISALQYLVLHSFNLFNRASAAG